MRHPTPRQLEILAFVRDYRAHHQRPPTCRDIGQHFNIQPNAARDHLLALERFGLIERAPGLARAIVVQ